MEALGIEVGRHGHAICEADFNFELVEDAIPIGGAAVFFRVFFFFGQPLGVLGLEVVVGIAEERFCRGDEFGIGVTQSKDGAFIGRSGLRVHIGVVWEGGVGM